MLGMSSLLYTAAVYSLSLAGRLVDWTVPIVNEWCRGSYWIGGNNDNDRIVFLSKIDWLNIRHGMVLDLATTYHPQG